jgi:putative salt-induced outer membrane protein YdiY
LHASCWPASICVFAIRSRPEEGPIRFVAAVPVAAARIAVVTLIVVASIGVVAAQAPLQVLPGEPLPLPSPPPAPKPPATPAWIASAGFGYAITSGNTNTSTLNMSFDVSTRPKAPNVFKADLIYLRGKEGGELSLNRLSTRARGEHTRAGGRTYVFGQIEGLRDTFKDIDYLIAPGVGLGHKVRDAPALLLFVDVGLGFKVEKNMDLPLRTEGAATASERFLRRLSDHAAITQSLAALWTLDRFDDALYTFKAGVTADLTRRAQIKLEVVDLYKTRPPAVTVKKNDVSLVTSVVYKF